MKNFVCTVNPLAKQAPQRAFGTIKIPGLLLTGTEDNSPIGETSAADRRIPFDGISAPHQYLVNFYGADHAVFGGGRAYRTAASSDEYHKMIEEVTGIFLSAALKSDQHAWSWFDDGGAAAYLNKKADFEKK